MPKLIRIESTLDRLLSAAELEILTRYLRKNGGSVTATAAELGISRRQLERKMEDSGLRELAGELREKAGIPGRR